MQPQRAAAAAGPGDRPRRAAPDVASRRSGASAQRIRPAYGVRWNSIQRWTQIERRKDRAESGHVFLVRADDLAVLHAGRTGRLAGPALQAQIEMLPHLVGQFGSAVGDGPPQIDAAARTVVLVAGFDVGWTRTQTQTAVNAVHEQLVVDVAPELGERRSRPARWFAAGSVVVVHVFAIAIADLKWHQ